MVQAKVKNDFDTRQVVLDAVNELHSLDHVATRQTIMELTGLKQSLVDDCLKYLCDEMMIRRLERGCYAPIKRYPKPRQIWQTVLDDGTVKIEIGDDVLTLTPKEARVMGMQLAGFMMMAGNIAMEQQFNILANQQQSDISTLRKTMAKMEKRNKRQLSFDMD